MEPSEKLQVFINDLFAFLKHNLELGYITPDMTIKQFRDDFLTKIDDNFIPMLREIEKYKNQ